MIQQKINRVDFSDIFNYAGEKFQIGWNPSNDIFFGEVLRYESFNEYYIGDLEVEEILERRGIEKGEISKDLLDKIPKDNVYHYNRDVGRLIIYQYMKDNNITEIFIDNT
jgi:hypothetical protein